MSLTEVVLTSGNKMPTRGPGTVKYNEQTCFLKNTYQNNMRKTLYARHLLIQIKEQVKIFQNYYIF